MRHCDNLDEPPCLLFAGLPYACGPERAFSHLKSLERLGFASDPSRNLREHTVRLEFEAKAFSEAANRLQEFGDRVKTPRPRQRSEIQEFSRFINEDVFEWTYKWINSKRLCLEPDHSWRLLATALLGDDDYAAEPSQGAPLVEVIEAIPEEDLEYWRIESLTRTPHRERLDDLHPLAILGGLGELLHMPWDFWGGVTVYRPYGGEYVKAMKAIEPIVPLQWVLAESFNSLSDSYEDRIPRVVDLFDLTLRFTPPSPLSQLVREMSEAYIEGHWRVVPILGRAVIEAAVHQIFSDMGSQPPSSGLGGLLKWLVDTKRIGRKSFQLAFAVKARGDVAVHRPADRDYANSKAALDTLTKVLAFLREEGDQLGNPAYEWEPFDDWNG